MNWFDLLAVKGTLKSLLQHHSSKASVLQHSAFFMVQLSNPYMTTGKTIALTMDLCQQSDVSAFKYAAFNFLPAVTLHSDFGTQENKICHCFHFCGPWYGVKRGLLLFNMLSSFVKAFLPRSKRLLISWLQSPSAVIMEPKKTKSDTVSPYFP